MKKLIAFLFVAMLATSVSFAADWTGSADGEFTADILCTPCLVGVTGGTVDLGNYFTAAGWQACPASKTVSYELKGPATTAGASYTITYEGDGGASINCNEAGTTEIKGTWSKFTEGNINCDNAETATYTADFLKTDGTLGTRTFTVTVNVSVDI